MVRLYIPVYTKKVFISGSIDLFQYNKYVCYQSHDTHFLVVKITMNKLYVILFFNPP